MVFGYGQVGRRGSAGCGEIVKNTTAATVRQDVLEASAMWPLLSTSGPVRPCKHSLHHEEGLCAQPNGQVLWW